MVSLFVSIVESSTLTAITALEAVRPSPANKVAISSIDSLCMPLSPLSLNAIVSPLAIASAAKLFISKLRLGVPVVAPPAKPLLEAVVIPSISPLPPPPLAAIVTAPAFSVIVTLEPAVKANVSVAPKVFPPAVMVLNVLSFAVISSTTKSILPLVSS